MAKDAKFLVAMPVLKQSIFSRSVIWMADQEKKGALGVIMNLPTGTLLNDALRLIDVNSKVKVDIPILFGGPVQTDFFWFIHSTEFRSATTIELSSEYYLSSALDILPYLELGQAPKIYFAGVGYSGWAEQQLEKEVEEGDWWLIDIKPEILFSAGYKEQWNVAIKTLGVDPDELVDLTDPMDPTVN